MSNEHENEHVEKMENNVGFRWEEYGIKFVISRLRLWCLIVLPLVGFGFSNVVLKLLFAVIFGWKHSSNVEIITSHLMTMAFMISTANELVFMNSQQHQTDSKEKAFFVCIAYLLLLGAMLGILV